MFLYHLLGIRKMNMCFYHKNIISETLTKMSCFKQARQRITIRYNISLLAWFLWCGTLLFFYVSLHRKRTFAVVLLVFITMCKVWAFGIISPSMLMFTVGCLTFDELNEWRVCTISRIHYWRGIKKTCLLFFGYMAWCSTITYIYYIHLKAAVTRK